MSLPAPGKLTGMQRPTFEKPDIDEKGAQGQRSSRRLFIQLLAFGNATQTQPLLDALDTAGISGALYADAHDPHGVALVTMSEDPAFFVEKLRDFLQNSPFAQLELKPDYTMFGRTYALGYEPDLEETLFDRPTSTVTNPDWPWAIWYPLRRSGEFEQLTAEQQREILMEHGKIGFSFGRSDYAHDVRLMSHGLDTFDNDFVIGLMGKELHPLSAVVQAMRKTTQTSLYLERLGPFFVGKAIWQKR